ncbi:MAG: ADOP family duplicated permease [Gemmatimonadaceae bacterium]
MSAIDALRYRVRALFGRRRFERELEAELRFHHELEEMQLRHGGARPDEARFAARRRFGSGTRVREEIREMSAMRWLDTLAQDLRFGVRSLRKSPGFATVAVVTLALGIAVTTAIFSVVDAVLLRPLAFPDAERLVVPQSTRRGTDDQWNIAYRDFRAWKDRGVFESVAVYQIGALDLTGHEQPVRVPTAYVSPEFFATLRIRPLLGRLPVAEEYTPGSPRPLVLSYGFWQRHFAGARDAVGKAVQVTGYPATIVGVLPKGTEWPRDLQMWHPFRARITESTLQPDNFIFGSVARLKPGATLESTRAELAALAAPLEEQFPAKRRGVTVTAVPLRDWMVGEQLTRTLWVLLGAVGFVLLIACVNIANLMLARGAVRGRELSVRTALGAGRGRIARQLLTESLVLALVGGALGTALALWGAKALIALAPSEALQAGMEIRLSLPVFAAALGATILSAIFFGLAPALQGSTARPGEALGERSTRTTAGVRSRRAASLLVVTEVALSLTLLAGAGLLTRSLLRLRAVDTGLDPRRVLTFQASIPQSRFNTNEKLLAFADELRRRLEGVPGVTVAATASALPVGGGGFYLGRTMIEAGAPEPPAGSEVSIMWNVVSAGYFRALGQPLLAGREFTARDDSAATPAIIVTRTFAEAMFPGRPPAAAVGNRVFSWRDERIAREIVGVVGDVRYGGVRDTAKPVVYVPLAQSPVGNLIVIVRASAGEAATLASLARRELAALDPGIAMASVRTMDEVLAQSVAPHRFTTLLLGSFATLAVLLAAVGLYGLLSYGVARRSHEIGVRMALGATGSGVVRLILRGSMILVGAGTIIGVVGSLAVTRVLGSLLFEVRPSDPAALAAAAGMLVTVALFASYVPARRATRVDPTVALRAD